MADAGDPARALLLSLFDAGLAAVDGRARMRAALAGRGDLGETWVLAVGKAATAMTRGSLDVLGQRLTRALIVTTGGGCDTALDGDARCRCLPGGHPHPDAASLAAGDAALRMARAARPGQQVLLLVSGGASSLIESPVEGISLSDLRQVSQWAFASGEPIGRVNAVRRRLSRLKNGGLAASFGHCRVEGFFISDVPGDDPAIVGSGLLARSGSADDDAGLPDWLRELLARAGTQAAAASPPPAHCVGCLGDALDAIEAAAAAAGLEVLRPSGRLAGDAVLVAGRTCTRLRAMRSGLLLLGGETTVVLPPHAGRGGRNQHLALAAAMQLEGREDLLLAAGTDGHDGNSDDAGGLIDGNTVQRGRDAGLDPASCLDAADSGRFLEASGDLVHTGATGTNVGDLLLALRRDPDHSQFRGRQG